MDKLQQRAIFFRNLLNYQYIIKLGRKNKLYEIVIDFHKQDFFHLIGFQKLIDLRFLKRSAEYIFNECIKGNITYDMLNKSSHFNELGYRFEYFNQLENILDDSFINKEDFIRFSDKIKLTLSSFEYCVLAAYLKYGNYSEVAQDQNVTVKEVNNALQRARKKIRKINRQHL